MELATVWAVRIAGASSQRITLADRTESNMENQAAFFAATERLNAGEEIPKVDPVLIEGFWGAVSKIPKERRGHPAVGLGAFASIDPKNLPPNPEQQVAMMARYGLLDALLERGFFSEYMENESQRKKVFAAAASFPCNKDDLGEALAERLLRDSPQEEIEEANKQLQEAGYDPTHLKVMDKFIHWMEDNC
jgi:hypothetical protein